MTTERRKHEFHLSINELSVLCAFAGMKCIYGVTPTWLPEKQSNMRKQVREVVEMLEHRGILLIEPGGDIHLPDLLQESLICLVHANRIGRWSVPEKRYSRQILFYSMGTQVAYIMLDGYGGCYVGCIREDKEKNIEKNKEKNIEKSVCQMVLEKMEKVRIAAAKDKAEEIPEWLSGLVFEKIDGEECDTYQVIEDIAWKKEEGEYQECYQNFAKKLLGNC